MTRTVFLGSPAIALPSLRAVAESPDVRLVGVVTQPDRPAGRRRRLRPCPVKAEAEAQGLPVFTPAKVGADESLEVLRAWELELAVVCAYGQIFPRRLLALPRLGCFNLHFSLLPRWRGASPVQAAIRAGDAHTGVTLQRMARELDAGEIVATTGPMPIAPEDTGETLGGRLAAAAAALLAQNLPVLARGDPPLRPQPAEGVTYCRIVRKEEGAVDFAAETAVEIERKCRAFTPWPGCYAFLAGQRLGLQRVALAQPPGEAGAGAAPGTLHADGRVPAREGWLQLQKVKPEGRGAMAFAAFRNGNPDAVGRRLAPGPA